MEARREREAAIIKIEVHDGCGWQRRRGEEAGRPPPRNRDRNRDRDRIRIFLPKLFDADADPDTDPDAGDKDRPGGFLVGRGRVGSAWYPWLPARYRDRNRDRDRTRFFLPKLFDSDADTDPDTDAGGKDRPGGFLVSRGRVGSGCCR